MKKLPHVTWRDAVEIRGVYGQSIFEFFQQGQVILERSAPNHLLSHFFAEPQLHVGRGEISWYTKAQGAVMAFTSLDADHRAVAVEAVRGIRQQIAEIADRFAGEGGTAAITRAEIFKTMLSEVDSLDCLYLVGDQPVMCEWGCKRIRAASEGDLLWSLGSALRTPASESNAREMGASPGPVLAPPAQLSVPDVIQLPSVGPDAERSDTRKEGLNDEDGRSTERPDETAAGGPAGPDSRSPPLPPMPQRQPPQPVQQFNRSDSAEEHSRDRHASPVERSYESDFVANAQSYLGVGVWSFIKNLIVVALLLILFLTMLRSCARPTELSFVTTSQNDKEEARLRSEIAGLRSEADRILATCSVR